MVEADGCLLDLLTAVPACANSDSLYAMTCSTDKISLPMFGFAGRLTFNSMYGRWSFLLVEIRRRVSLLMKLYRAVW